MNQNQDLIALEKKLLDKEERLDNEKEKVEKNKAEVDKIKEDYRQKLSKVSGLTEDEAKQELVRETELKEAKIVAKIIKEKEEEARRTADKKGREILIDSMRHGAVNYIAEYTV